MALEDPIAVALSYAAAGLSVVPIETDGSKKPPARQAWKHLQQRIATEGEIRQLFPGKGIAVINGKVSGNLETLDIDDPALVEPFEAAVRELAPGLLERLPTAATPRNEWGGRHYRYRSEAAVSSNTKLAQSELRPQFHDDGAPDIDPRTGKQRLAPETLIETRGEGGYAIVPGSPPECHETGLPYKHVAGPPLTDVPTITAEEHRILWHVAKSFNRFVDQREVKDAPANQRNGDSPGDAFNARAIWEDILVPAGWTIDRTSGELTFWRRPGKSKGISATTGVRSSTGTELLCVFSTNAYPFEGPANGRNCSSYSKFAAYTVLNHDGDYSAAAKSLAAKGYGVSPKGKQNKAAKPGEPAVPARKLRLPEPFIPFPTGVLPAPIRNYIREAAGAIGCDETLVGLPMLAALAGCIGSSRRLRIKGGNGGWFAPAVLWTAAVVDSGQQKSPAQSAVTRLLYARQGRDLAAHAEQMIEFQKKQAAYERELADWKRPKKGAIKGEPPEKPEEPICKRIIVSDSTIEAIADRLQDNQRGLLLDRDELSGWLGSYDQYRGGKGSDVSHWLSCYNAKPLLIDRKTSARKTIYVERAAVSVTGGIQPRILARLLGQKHFENGLAARFGFAMPPRTNKRWSEATVSEDTEEALDWTYDWLLALRFGTDAEGKPIPVDLPLTLDGKEAFIEFYNQHGREQAELTGDLAALWAKLEEVAARIALVMHLVRCATDDSTLVCQDAVDATSISMGINLVRWFGNEGRRIYGVLAESDDERDRRLLIELIQRKGGRITARDLSRASRRHPTSDAAEQALIELVEAGAGRWEAVGPTEAGGRPTRVFRLAVDETTSKPAEEQGFGYADTQQEVTNAAPYQDDEETEWTL